MEEGSCAATPTSPCGGGHGRARDAHGDQEPQLLPQRARAIEHEVARQAAVLDSGGEVSQETLLWNPSATRRRPCARRGGPRLPLLPGARPAAARGRPGWIDEVRRSLPELPVARRQRLEADTRCPGTTPPSSRRSATSPTTSRRRPGPAPTRSVSNWVMTEVLRKLKDDARPRHLARQPGRPRRPRPARRRGHDQRQTAKDVFERMWATARTRPRSSSGRASSTVRREGARGDRRRGGAESPRRRELPGGRPRPWGGSSAR